jgi:hypothetical protein
MRRGLYYYGARYYDARTSIWASVDPMAEKMPAWSPYNYTLNNPILYTDPDGRLPIIPIIVICCGILDLLVLDFQEKLPNLHQK